MIRLARTILAFGALYGAAAPLSALPLAEPTPRYHWECAPFARAVSGIQIYGDAYTWWDQAEGRYKRGHRPKIGAVLAFLPHGRMELGHVATVSDIIDDRTILVAHANWSPINGRRGQVERDVKVIDVSEAGDWSAVRVWYAPNEDMGGAAWPVHGFIYPPRSVTAAPKLPYANVLAWTASLDEVRRPTGRIAYLGKLLPGLVSSKEKGRKAGKTDQ
ncbi:CHAP domain-containing protein [Aquisediminimonas profunda]|uniref:CHAP domain-containing protein n=1 Tax=Aquisediminimonas profunda TaxID=1550733 RepID=UPI001C632428|nr:CHAP domain-containing protein [Aquisediminimonas profunda]